MGALRILKGALHIVKRTFHFLKRALHVLKKTLDFLKRGFVTEGRFPNTEPLESIANSESCVSLLTSWLGMHHLPTSVYAWVCACACKRVCVCVSVCFCVSVCVCMQYQHTYTQTHTHTHTHTCECVYMYHVMCQVECTALHASILRAASTLGHLPLNIIPGCFDIASLAVHAILGIDHKFWFAGLVHYIFIHFGGAKAALWARIFLRVCMCVCECGCVWVCVCVCVCVCMYMSVCVSTYECVMRHVRMRYSTCADAPCPASERVVSRLRMRCV